LSAGTALHAPKQTFAIILAIGGVAMVMLSPQRQSQARQEQIPVLRISVRQRKAQHHLGIARAAAQSSRAPRGWARRNSSGEG
jgi:hypothetical protein